MDANFYIPKEAPVDATFKIYAFLTDEGTSKIAKKIQELANAIDAEVQRATDEEELLRTDLNTEILDRQVADNELRDLISEEADKRLEADGELRQAIEDLLDKEIKDIEDLDTKIDEINADLSQRMGEVEDLVDSIKEEVDEVKQDVSQKYQEITEDISNLTDIVEGNFEELKKDIGDEASAREQADNILDQKITDEIADREKAISDLDQALSEKLSEEISKREEGDSTLQEEIDELTGVVNKDREDSVSRDEALGVRIDNIEAEITEGYVTKEELAAEVSAREQADTTLQGNIDTLSQTVSSNYTTLDGRITSEVEGLNTRITEVAEELNETIETNVTALQQADTNLQTQITTNKNDIADLTQVVQDDYTELDNAIKAVDSKADTNATSITKEIKDRGDADTQLQSNIDTLTNTVSTNKTDSENRDVALGERIDNLKIEIEGDFATKEELSALDTALSKDIDDLDKKLSKEIEDLGTTTDELQGEIDDLEADLTSYKEANDKAVSDLSDTVQNNYTTLDGKISTETTNRENADNKLQENIDTLEGTVSSNYTTLDNKIDGVDTRLTEVAEEINQTIEDNVVALQQEDTALQNQINAHSQTLTSLDTRITTNTNAITQEVADRQAADTTLQDNIDTEASTREQADTALQNSINAEAKTRKDTDDDLQDQIDNLKARGRFLAIWNATTGLAETNPTSSPYKYNTGDYFIVGTVGETNYKPTGLQYVIGSASTVQETEELATEDVYYFDGQTWHLQINHGKTVSFANLAGEPSDNINLKNALDSKQDVIEDLEQIRTNAETGAGLKTQVKTNTTDISNLKSDKQDVINDLDTIRSNASAGKTAKDTIDTYGDIVTHNVEEFQEAGDYATNTALTEGLAKKQNNISDLEEIRTNASAGKSAKDTIDTYGNIVTHNVEEFQEAGDYATNTALTEGLATKQDTIGDLETIRSNASAGKSAKDTIDTYGNIVTHNVEEFQLAGEYATKTELTDGLRTKQDVISDLEQIRTDSQTGAGLKTQVETNTTEIGDLKESKQDTISDLEAIRSNASAGKSAKDTIDTYGDIVTHNVEEFQEAGDYATNTALTEGLAKKQDTISDLDTIREGAALGATALQSFTETDPIYEADKPNIALKSEIPTDNAQLANGAGYITAEYHDFTKQDVVEDLSTIRSNAEAGKDASDTISTYGNIVTHNIEEFQVAGDYATNTRVNEVEDKIPSLEGYATETYVQDYHDSTKQDVISDLEQIRDNAEAGANLTAQVGTNTTDISDLKLNKADKDELPSKLSDLEDDITNSLGSELDYTGTTLSLLNEQSDVLSTVTIKSTPDLDETTINLNSEEKLQSIGNILQSGGYQKYWEGTKAQFNAIEAKDPNTLYQVLDDEEHALFEVDGTSIEFNNDNILQIPQNVDYGIQEQTWGDGESGYTLHRNGKLEQWGVATTSANGEVEFTMHTSFRDLNFSVFIEPREMGDFFHYAIPSANNKFRCRTKGANGYIMGIKIQWRAYGYYR